MIAQTAVTAMAGEWTGRNRLWFGPDQAALESDTAASVSLIAADRFASFRYMWEHEGTPHDGLIWPEGREDLAVEAVYTRRR